MRTPVVLCSNMHRVSTEESWRQPPSQCILVSGLPPGVSAGIQREGPGGVGCLHPGVVLFLLLWMAPAVLGLGPCLQGVWRDLVAPLNSLDLAVVHWVQPPRSSSASGPGWQGGTWPGRVPAFPPVSVLPLSEPSQHLSSRLVISTLFTVCFPNLPLRSGVILFTVYVWNPGRIKSNHSVIFPE